MYRISKRFFQFDGTVINFGFLEILLNKFYKFVPMNPIDLTEDLRTKINAFLNKNYGMELPIEEKCILEDKRNYIHMDEDNGNCIYISKSDIN